MITTIVILSIVIVMLLILLLSIKTLIKIQVWYISLVFLKLDIKEIKFNGKSAIETEKGVEVDKENLDKIEIIYYDKK